jgi:hypothetical protein
MGYINNTINVHDESEVMSEANFNYCINKLSILQSQNNLLQTWQGGWCERLEEENFKPRNSVLRTCDCK